MSFKQLQYLDYVLFFTDSVDRPCDCWKQYCRFKTYLDLIRSCYLIVTFFLFWFMWLVTEKKVA